MEGRSVRSAGDESTDKAVRVTKSIMIIKPPGYHGGSPLVSPSASSTPPISPAGSTPPVSPFSGEKFRLSFFPILELSIRVKMSFRSGWVPQWRLIFSGGR